MPGESAGAGNGARGGAREAARARRRRFGGQEFQGTEYRKGKELNASCRCSKRGAVGAATSPHPTLEPHLSPLPPPHLNHPHLSILSPRHPKAPSFTLASIPSINPVASPHEHTC